MCFSIHLVTNFNNTGGFRFSAALETKQSHVTSVDLNFWFIESSLLLWLLTSGPLSSPLEALFSPLPGGGRTTVFLEVLGAKTFYHPSNPFPVIGLFGRYMLGGVGCLRYSRLLSLHTGDLPLILEGCSFLDLLETEPQDTEPSLPHSAHISVCSHWTVGGVQRESSRFFFFPPFGHFLCCFLD